MGEKYLKQVIDKPVSEDGSVPGGLVFAASRLQGWERLMEDYYVCRPHFDGNTSLWAVFDGHNGPEVAEYAAEHLPEIIKLNGNYRRGQYERGFEEAFLALDERLTDGTARRYLNAIRQKHTDRGSIHVPIHGSPEPGVDSGCTAIVVLIKEGQLFIAHIGSPRAYIVRNGQVERLTNDHKPSDAAEKARVVNAGGRVIDGHISGRMPFSRAFGHRRYKRGPGGHSQRMVTAKPTYKSVAVNATDAMLVVVSAGVWRAIPEDTDLIKLLGADKNTKRLSAACEGVFRHILEMPANGTIGKDNMTSVIVKFDGSGPTH
ncbi:unnamed protein product [Oppiella nova]|uniref:protein-serine/threonine phosphatase n=1 Tax=Oppiella nova TaxID=334625 RepID=A0A7R9QW56_9ACAR|nr:unnamed protein product [Oppiella nova]CAG2177825.1 unnamed protein product [Oppiella nova]